jgi:hypothetical protein
MASGQELDIELAFYEGRSEDPQHLLARGLVLSISVSLSWLRYVFILSRNPIVPFSSITSLRECAYSPRPIWPCSVFLYQVSFRGPSRDGKFFFLNFSETDFLS